MFGRCFFPEGHRQAVSVVDANGNFILRLGAYGNADDRGPEVRFAYTRYITVNDSRLYINDTVNHRILSVSLASAQEKILPLEQAP